MTSKKKATSPALTGTDGEHLRQTRNRQKVIKRKGDERRKLCPDFPGQV
jgi:hypothetical protein